MGAEKGAVKAGAVADDEVSGDGLTEVYVGLVGRGLVDTTGGTH